MLTAPRLKIALAEFFVRYGYWPSRVYMDPDLVRDHYAALLEGRYPELDRPFFQLALPKLQILARADANHLVEGDGDDAYDYRTGSRREDIPHELLVRAWLADQTRAHSRWE